MSESAAPPPDDAPLSASIVTCSFRGDFELCRMLCDSIDRFVPATIHHALYVPAQDVALFASLSSPRRTIATQESLLPRWLRKVPMPSARWRRLLGLSHRNFYVTPFGLPVRGWIAQQIMKIAATAAAPTEVVAHIDSDNVVVRPLGLDRLVHGGRVRIYRDPAPVPLASHRRWHVAAGRLLGLPPSDFYGAEYIDPFVVWRRSTLRGMIARIEAVAGRDWRVVLSRTPHFAEYVLYGVYADKVAGLDASGLCPEAWSLCHSRYSGSFDGGADEARFVAALRPEHVTCLIQSTIPVPESARLRLFAQVTARAADQDRAAAGAR
ncbi:DUF6492 family protein [Blastochloris viridis]|nr:DUF6492 family protein [Blastochloris viridis]ALK10789.1 hypothetical protein BVIR_3028 [Blastochloris viridis]CUU43451.1 hypothetical protein BVIRIDIS_24720 [Blastochloris viridis]